jgi:hypothetical protein
MPSNRESVVRRSRRFDELKPDKAEAVMAFVVDKLGKGKPWGEVVRQTRDKFHLRG